MALSILLTQASPHSPASSFYLSCSTWRHLPEQSGPLLINALLEAPRKNLHKYLATSRVLHACQHPSALEYLTSTFTRRVMGATDAVDFISRNSRNTLPSSVKCLQDALSRHWCNMVNRFSGLQGPCPITMADLRVGALGQYQPRRRALESCF